MTNHKDYSVIQHQRQTLAALIKRQLAVSHSLSMIEGEETLHELRNRVLTDNFKVLVMGEFSRGKSTFINALLKKEILPADPRPYTAIINQIKWAKKPIARLHYKKFKDGSVKPPQEIPVDKINNYVAVNYEEKKNAKQQIHENPYEKLELFWPLELCSQGVEIIDSPGLNVNKVHQDITENYLSNVDAVLFVLSCTELGSETEIKTIDNTLRVNGYEDIFFICNRFDQIRAKERDGVKRYAFDLLAPRSNGGEKYVFFISALDALDGYLDKDMNLIEISGIQHVEEALQSFLVNIKGRVKIIQPAKQLKVFIHKAKDTIPQRKKMLETPLKKLEERYKANQEPLQQLEKARQNMIMKVSYFREDVKDLVRFKVRRFYEDVVEKIAPWIEEYEIQEPVKLFSTDVFKLEKAIERVVEEITNYLSEKVEDEFATWQKEELQPFFASRLESLMRELDEKAGEFLSQVDKIRLDIISGSPQSMPSVEVEEAKISPLERIFSAAGGYLLMDFGSGLIGFTFGYKEMLKSLIPQLAIVAGTVFLAGLNPLVLIPTILGTGLIQGLIKVDATNEKIKNKVSKEYLNQMRSSGYKQSNEMAAAVATKLGEIQETIDKGLGNEIQGIRNQVKSILAEKQKEQANMEQKVRELASIEKELNAIDSELDEIITQMVLL